MHMIMVNIPKSRPSTMRKMMMILVADDDRNAHFSSELREGADEENEK